jgi:hypothetical protein
MRPEKSEKPDSLEARLRSLPPPPVPIGLEARLLAGIAAKPMIRQWHWTQWVGGVGAFAAACLLIVLAWPKGEGQKAVLDPKDRVTTTSPTPTVPPRSPKGTLQAQREPDDSKLPPFAWPVDEAIHVTLSSSIPSDLLN